MYEAKKIDKIMEAIVKMTPSQFKQVTHEQMSMLHMACINEDMPFLK